MRYTAQRDYEKTCEAIEKSDMDEYEKESARTEAATRRDYIFETERRRDEQRDYSYVSSSSSSSGCLIMLGFMTAFAGLAGVSVAKTISSATELKQPENINVSCKKPTLVSKHKIVTPKNLDKEHSKN